jgi:hypothetical protein
MTNAVGARALGPAARGTFQVLAGLGLGAIPLLVALVGAYGGTIGGSLGGISLSRTTSLACVIAGGVLYLTTLVAMIVCLRSVPLRFVGYGWIVPVGIAPGLFVLGSIVFYLMTGPLLFGFVDTFRLTGPIL